MLLLAVSQIYNRVFHLRKTIDLHSGWVGHSRAYKLSFLSLVLARLEMRHTRIWGEGIPTNAYLAFKDATFSPPPNLDTCIPL